MVQCTNVKGAGRRQYTDPKLIMSSPLVGYGITRNGWWFWFDTVYWLVVMARHGMVGGFGLTLCIGWWLCHGQAI